MARSRNIKPGFFQNEQLAELHPLTRILFAGLWTIADRDGRLEDRPKRIKAQCLPYDDHDVDKALDDLADCGFIVRYEVDANRFVEITKWHDHQKPHARETESCIPGIDEASPRQCQGTTKENKVKVKGISNKVKGIRNQESERRDPFSEFWQLVPRKAAKAEAKKAYAKAIREIKARPPTEGGSDPHGFLCERMAAFAASPKAQGEYCPYPATWLNKGRYDDDPATWYGGDRSQVLTAMEAYLRGKNCNGDSEENSGGSRDSVRSIQSQAE